MTQRMTIDQQPNLQKNLNKEHALTTCEIVAQMLYCFLFTGHCIFGRMIHELQQYLNLLGGYKEDHLWFLTVHAHFYLIYVQYIHYYN